MCPQGDIPSGYSITSSATAVWRNVIDFDRNDVAAPEFAVDPKADLAEATRIDPRIRR